MHAIRNISFALALLLAAQISFADEESSIHAKLGFRAGFGVSLLRHHVKLADLKPVPSIAYSVGAVAQIDLSDNFSISPELLYSAYSSSAEKVNKIENGFDRLTEVGVELHALELPVLARYDFGGIYAEAGPQVGWNFSSKMYTNAEYFCPDLNPLAFGIAAGFGTDSYGILLLGIRAYFGILEYAKDAKGVPWSLQASLSAFLF
ncbi:MAG: PorT family protein [Fibromonadales bacterium]|nr:PorT family protein [Fibromonadales bacterium]